MKTQITSSAGKTALRSKIGGFDRSGPDVSKHPYLTKGWLVEHNGVGVFRNLSPI